MYDPAASHQQHMHHSHHQSQRNTFVASPNTMYCSPPDINTLLLQPSTNNLLPSPLVHRFALQRQHSDINYLNAYHSTAQQNNNILSSPNTHPSSYHQPIATQLSLFGSPHHSAVPLPRRDNSIQYNTYPNNNNEWNHSNQLIFDNLSTQQQQQHNDCSSQYYTQSQPNYMTPIRSYNDVQHKPATRYVQSKHIPSHYSSPPRPLHERTIYKLTHSLMNTYNSINEKYYQSRVTIQQPQQIINNVNNTVSAVTNTTVQHNITKTCTYTSTLDTVSYNNGYDDREYNYIMNTNELLNNRYRVESQLGKGSFGRVVKCYDIQSSQYVAVKIVKSKSAFYKQAQIEINILSYLNTINDNHSHAAHVVRMLDTFIHHSHQCIVFELLRDNLYDLLKHTRFNGLPFDIVIPMAIQLLETLQFLQSNRNNDKHILHCDLKPENILLNYDHSLHSTDTINSSQLQSIRNNPSLTVIDFGSACYYSNKAFSYIQSRFYRAPEVLLGQSYNTAIDMFSLGCVLYELYTGRPLFDGCDETDQLIKHYSILGTPPANMLHNNRKADKYYTLDLSMQSYRLRTKYINRHTNKSLRDTLSCKWINDTQHEQFEHLLQQMLQYDPKQRIKPCDALQHPFITSYISAIQNNSNTNTISHRSRSVANYAMSATSSPLCQPCRSINDYNNSNTTQQQGNSMHAPVLATIKWRTQSYAIPVDSDMYNNMYTNDATYGRKRAYSASTSNHHQPNNNAVYAIVSPSCNTSPLTSNQSTLFNQLQLANMKQFPYNTNNASQLFSPKMLRSNTNERVAVMDLMNTNDEQHTINTRHQSFDMVVSPAKDCTISIDSQQSSTNNQYINTISMSQCGDFLQPKTINNNRSRRSSDADTTRTVINQCTQHTEQYNKQMNKLLPNQA